MFVLTLIFISVFIFLGGISVYFYFRSRRRKDISELLQLKLFLIRFPKSATEGKELKQEINLSEQFFSSLASFKKPVAFEVAVPHVGEEIHFYAAVPGKFGDAFLRQIQSVWNDAKVERADEYNIFNYDGVVSGAHVSLERHFALPIRTYQELGVDTFAPLLGGISKINEVGEGGAIQFILYPSSPDKKKNIASVLKSLKKGSSLKNALDNSVAPTFSDIRDAFLSSPHENKEKEKVVDEQSVKTIEMKLSKPLFDVNIRVLSSAPSQEQADSILDGIIAGFSQFNAPERNEFQIVRKKNPKDLVYKFSFREFDKKHSSTLNSEELASVFHFPTPFTALQKIKELRFKESSPPSDLPKEGIVLGESRYQNEVRSVRLTREDRRRHVYIIGQTGTGKTVLINNLSGQDIENGEGVCVIDPNGDLFEDVLSRIPKSRAKDVVVFDPSDLNHPFGLNMLEYDPQFPEHKTFIINEMMMIFDTLYDLKTTGGPMFEQYTRNALLLLMDDPSDGCTILEIPRVLADSEFRKKLLAKCKNIIAKDFWEKEAEKAGGEASLANIVPYITSKFNTFIANDYVRPIIAQSKSTLNFRQIMDEGKILLVNLSKGRIGDLNSSLLGMIIVGKLTISAFSRTDMSMEKRKDFYLYIDEFQSFTTPSISTILSEARKYRLCLTMAHQFIAQLSEEIRDAVFGNVGSIVSFRVGADDAEYLAKQFEPVFNASNLMNIDNLNSYVKLIINGQVARPFNIFVPFPLRGDASISELIREYSRLSYGRPRDIVEEEIYKRLRV